MEQSTKYGIFLLVFLIAGLAIISVSGVLKQLINDGTGNYIARLAGDRNGKAMIDCHLDSQYLHSDLSLRAGDSVTIRGTCAGRWVNIILLECIVEK